MKKLTQEEKKIVLLDILTAVDAFCKEHDIRYSMACGTMLGAVRHKGFIPWDDDIDIYVLREDYSRLEKLFPDLLDGKYRFVSFHRTPEWHCVYGKVVDDRTISVNTYVTRVPLGINIDVYPIDDVPENDVDWVSYRKKQKQAVYNVKYKNLKLSLNNSLRLNSLLLMKKLPILLRSKRQLLMDLDRLAQSNNGKGFSKCFECCQGLVQQRPFPKALFDSVISWPFEDRYFIGFQDADAYLKNGYGDYMKLPPKEKQVLVHGYDSYWKER